MCSSTTICPAIFLLTGKPNVTEEDINWFFYVQSEKMGFKKLIFRWFWPFNLYPTIMMREPEVRKIANTTEFVSFEFILVLDIERLEKNSPSGFCPTSVSIASM